MLSHSKEYFQGVHQQLIDDTAVPRTVPVEDNLLGCAVCVCMRAHACICVCVCVWFVDKHGIIHLPFNPLFFSLDSEPKF